MKPFYVITGAVLAAVTIGIVVATAWATADLLHARIAVGLAMSSIVILVIWGIVAISVYAAINSK